jgi:uncharacterized delta-60 repeat protein
MYIDEENIIWITSGIEESSYKLIGGFIDSGWAQEYTIDFSNDSSGPVYPVGITSDSENFYILTERDVRFYSKNLGINLTKGFNGIVRAITLQSDGKILVGGEFTEYNGEYAGRLIRLNSDGSIDQGFTSGGNEFNGTVNTIAVQRDGKIVVGGSFNQYYNFNCNQIVRLNSDGTFDPTFVIGDGFDGDEVFTITTEIIENIPFYVTNEPPTYTENIIVGGRFSYYKGTNNIGGIVKLSPTGDVLPDFGNGFNRDTGSTPRVNKIVKQPDGKLIVIGGGYGHDILDYNETWIPKNIVRLVKNDNGIYQIDQTFTTRNWDEFPYNGGFGGGAFTLTVLPNGKIMVGGFFSYYGDNNYAHNDISHLVRLNSNGTLDTTFTFELSAVVYTSELLSSGALLVGGRFQSPTDRLVELFIGEDYELRSFTTCDGVISNIFLPTGFQTETLLDLVPTPQDPDDSNYVVKLPLPFDVNFLGTNYTEINVSTNSYITFGSGGNPTNCCFTIPNEINSNGPSLPGVYISTTNGLSGCMDDYLFNLYSGLTDYGNTMVIRYEGTYLDYADNGETIDTAPPLVYNFKFYKDNSEYFDLIIESNTEFCDSDSTGGTSDGTNSFIDSFDSSSENSYRINSDGTIEILTYAPFDNTKPIKANVSDRVAVCGSVGNVISTSNLNEGSSINGSMYFNGTDSLVTIDYNSQMDLNFGPWTVEWYQKYTSTDTCCRRVFDIGQWTGEEFGVSIENNNTILLWMASGSTTINLNTPVYNVWTYFAITSENVGGDDQIIRVYQDGVLIYSGTTTVDLNNFQGDPVVQLPLVIGGGNGSSSFEGYITNFRWSKGALYYDGPTMEVPTSPLVPYNASLLFTTVNEAGLLTNDCISGGFIPANEISANNVTWSTETPFVNLNNFSLFTATDSTTYNSCSDCGQTYKTKLLVRDGLNTDKVETYQMTLNSINNVLTNGPIFTTRGPECYEILKYTY